METQLGVRFHKPVQVQKVENVITQSGTTIKKRTESSCVFTVRKVNTESVNTQNDYETTSKKWADKKNTGLFFVFCK